MGLVHMISRQITDAVDDFAHALRREFEVHDVDLAVAVDLQRAVGYGHKKRVPFLLFSGLEGEKARAVLPGLLRDGAEAFRDPLHKPVFHIRRFKAGFKQIAQGDADFAPYLRYEGAFGVFYVEGDVFKSVRVFAHGDGKPFRQNRKSREEIAVFKVLFTGVYAVFEPESGVFRLFRNKTVFVGDLVINQEYQPFPSIFISSGMASSNFTPYLWFSSPKVFSMQLSV